MFRNTLLLCCLSSTFSTVLAQCPDYTDYSNERHEPFSAGNYQLSYQRPSPECRTFVLPEVDAAIEEMKDVIQDQDLFRLFENAYPNTLDTTITWRGFANNGIDGEELAFVTTGDIRAMWLRDSANQLRSYKSFLQANESTESLASVYRGAINLQSRYITTNPYCNAFQAPTESGLPAEDNGWASTDQVKPTYSTDFVFECKYELDSISAFLQLSYDYYTKTQDAEFFGKYQWVDTVKTILDVAEGLLIGTYADNGAVNELPYTFQREQSILNSGLGSPVRGGTGLVRSAFRPSDDQTIYQLFIPANMMFSSYLAKCAEIMEPLNATTSQRMSEFASSVRDAVNTHGKVTHDTFGEIYAFEVDGYGSTNLMDDANSPSLLGMPIFDFLDVSDPTYQNTRKFALSDSNPYYNWGPEFSGIGGPHDGPGKAWPMSIIVSLLTTDNDDEITNGLQALVSTTDGLGLIHESIDTFNTSVWTRQWFAWANGLFGEMVLGLNETNPQLLAMSYQGGQ